MTATAAASVPHAARALRDQWHHLIAGAVDPADFGPEMVAGFSGAARRWLTHAIAPGTPLDAPLS